MSVNLNLTKPELITNFLKKFRNKTVLVDLIRIGGDSDGGYLVPNILENIDFCFSPGVNNVIDFELQLSNEFGIKSFMADASISSLNVQNSNFYFIPKYLGSINDGNFITLSKWIEISSVNDSSNLILQMDIEGFEYEVLTYESEDTLNKFSIMVIEFHYVNNIAVINSFLSFSSIFEKIFKNFSICHLHPNNYSKIENYNGIEIPTTLEISFIRNDKIEKIKKSNQINLPNVLDRKNNPEKPDIIMPRIWWDSNVTI